MKAWFKHIIDRFRMTAWSVDVTENDISVVSISQMIEELGYHNFFIVIPLNTLELE